MGKFNQIKAGAVLSYITIFFNILSGLLYTPWLMSQLGRSDYALYTLVLSVMTYFVLDFGMGAAITRFIARYKANGEDEKINDFLGVSTKLYLLLDVIVLIAVVVVYSFLDQIYVNLTPPEIEKFKVIFAIAGSMSVLSFPFLPQSGVFTAYEKVYAYKVFDLMQKILTVGLIVVALLLNLGLYAVVLINAVVTFVMHLIKFFYITKSEKLRINLHYWDKGIVKSLFGFSAWVTVASWADRLFFTFIPSLLGMFSNSFQITIFSVVVSIEQYVNLFSSAFSNLFLPRVTRMVVNKENPEKITNLMIRVGRIQLIIVSTVVIALIGLGEEFIFNWVGHTLGEEGVHQAYIILVMVMLPSLVHFCQAIAVEMIYATNNVKYRALVYTLGSAISIVLTVWLSPRYGALGAGIGISTALWISHVFVINIIYKKKLKLNVYRYFKEVHFKILMPSLISLLISLSARFIYPVQSMGTFFIKCACWGICHLVIVWFMVLNKEEKNIANGFLKKIRIR